MSSYPFLFAPLVRCISIFHAAVICWFALSAGSACSNAATPSIESLNPPIGSRGSTFEVVVRGSSLSQVSEVMVYKAGLRCQSLQMKGEDELVLEMAAEKDCSLEAYPIRLRSNEGFSELRTITVTPFPTVHEDVESSSQLVKPNRTVIGKLERDDVDSFAIEMTKGQRLSGEVHAMRLGGALLDTKLTLIGPQGEVVLVSDDTPILNQDPCFSVLVESTGKYVIEISSSGGNADADSFYALHLGDFPRPQGLTPLGGPRDGATQVSLFQKLPDEKDADQIEIDTVGASIGTQYFEVKLNGISCPSKVPFRVGDFPNVVDQTKPASTPCAFHGDIAKTNEVDNFSFGVSRPGKYCVEVYASRLGSLLDAVVSVSNSQGEEIARGDDLDSHDPRLEFNAEPDEIYTISIRDKRNKAGELFHYRIEVSEPKAEVAIFLPRRDKLSQARQSIAVPTGNRVLAFFGLRRDVVDESLQLRFHDLPVGLRYQLGNEHADSFVQPVVFEANENVSLVGTLTRVDCIAISKPDLPAAQFQQVVDLIAGPADAIFTPVTVDRLAVAITKPIPFSVELEQPTVSLPIDGTLELQVRVQRQKDFNAAIDVSIPQLPEWLDAPAKVQIPPGQDAGTLLVTARSNAKPMEWPLVVEASVGIAEAKLSMNDIGASAPRPTSTPLDFPVVCSSLRTLSISESPWRGSIAEVSAEQGQSLEINCPLSLKSTVPMRLSATLEGLPNRVTADTVTIDSSQTSVQFIVKFANDAPVGTFPNVVCRLSGELDGQSISYCVARDTKLVISGKGQSQKDEQGRPITPLDALRRRSSALNHGTNTHVKE
jgi:hypothetical protein